jgi:hypothetical protein
MHGQSAWSVDDANWLQKAFCIVWRQLQVLSQPTIPSTVLAASKNRDDRIADNDSLKREVARLRKRFQLVVERLRTLANERKLA